MFNINKHCVQTEIRVFWYLFIFIISSLLKLARSLSSIFQDLASSVPTRVYTYVYYLWSSTYTYFRTTKI